MMKKLTVLALILAAAITSCQPPDKPAGNGFQVMAYFYPRGDDFDPDDYSKKHVIRDVYINCLRGISTQKGLDLINFYETNTGPSNGNKNK